MNGVVFMGEFLGLSNFVSAFRHRAGLNQTDLGRMVGCSKNTISSIESGTSVPSIYLCLCLADVLHTTVDSLFTVSDPVPCGLCGGPGFFESYGDPDGPLFYYRCGCCHKVTKDYYSLEVAKNAFVIGISEDSDFPF